MDVIMKAFLRFAARKREQKMPNADDLARRASPGQGLPIDEVEGRVEGRAPSLRRDAMAGGRAATGGAR
jgi:hypothetical protein